MDDTRPTKDQYFMTIARAVAARATCCRRKVGAVLVREGHILATGYNGSPEGLEHCIESGCEMYNGHCVRCVHAEANVLIQSGLVGSGTAQTTLYTTASPCRSCMGLIVNARVKRIVYAEPYLDATHAKDESRWALDTATRLGIAMTLLGQVVKKPEV